MTGDPALGRDENELGFALAAIAVEAGATIMAVRASGFEARRKADASPVTEADERAEAIILSRLARLLPQTPIIAEESFARDPVLSGGAEFLLVDPLDGTREFIAGNDDFTVNIALIRQAAPVAATVFAPAKNRLWCSGEAAFSVDDSAPITARTLKNSRQIQTRRAPSAGLVALVSRSHPDARTEQILARLPIAERRPMGSSLKFCVVAEARADIYPRFGPTMEWDTAAGDAILRAAGGIILGEDGSPLRYGQRAQGYRNGGFVAWGDRAAASAFALPE